jgi:DeoR/GlpR family transcriptional regulator of sugar metabolism
VPFYASVGRVIAADPRFGPERKAAIVTLLKRDGRVVSTSLANEFGVSIDTVRRDLDELEAAGTLKRVHGGAVLPLPGEPRFLDRVEDEEPAKERLAALAAPLLSDGEVIALGGGTTTLQLARSLPADLRATVITASLDVAIALRDHARVSVDVLGGRLDRESQTLTGAGTVDQLRRLRPDVCVVSPCGLDVREGLTLREYEEAQVVTAMLERSRRTIVLASAAKLGAAGPYLVAPAAQVSTLVTDAPEERLAPFRELGLEVVTG